MGLRWDDITIRTVGGETRGHITVRQQVVEVDGSGVVCPFCGGEHRGYRFGPPKTASGEARRVDLDANTVGVLLAQQLAQQTEREVWGDAYNEHGLVFAREDGSPVPPGDVTAAFYRLTDAAGLRRVRLHDLRHGQASLMLAAGISIAVVSKRLGHSSISSTSDTYSHLLEGVGQHAAEAAADLVPRTKKAPRKYFGGRRQPICNHEAESEPREAAEPGGSCRSTWWGRWGSNPRPADYESAALTD